MVDIGVAVSGLVASVVEVAVLVAAADSAAAGAVSAVVALLEVGKNE